MSSPRLTRDGYRRAVPGDAEYGYACPECSSPKDRRALRCAYCYHRSRVTTGLHIRGASRSERGRFRGESHLPAVKGRAA